MKYIAVFITTGSEAEAGKIARSLVEDELAACVSIIRQVRSVYAWKGKVEDSRECLLIAKTKQQLFGRVERSVRRMHSYECPEIVAIPVKTGSKGYLSWISKSTK